MTRPIRVLHCVGSMDRGGTETWLMRVLRRIDRQEFELDFCCLSGRGGAYASEIEALGSKVYTCRLGRNLYDFNRRLQAIFELGRYDIVHSHVHYFSGYILWRAKAAGITGRIAHSHSNSDGRRSTLARVIYRKWMQRWISRYATVRIAVAQEPAAVLFGKHWRLDPDIRVVRCGIDLFPFLQADQSHRDQTRTSLGLTRDSLVVGHVGRFEAVKNHLFFVEMAPYLVQRQPNAQFLLVGDGPLRSYIEKEIRTRGLDKKFILTGVRDDIPQLLNAMDVFVMPSLYEGLPIAGLEAQAAGVPSLFSDRITSEVEIMSETVRFLSLNAPITDWVEAIIALARMPRASAATRGLTFNEKGFSIELSVKQLSDIYREVLA